MMRSLRWTALLLFSLAGVANAVPVVVCPKTDGGVAVTRFATNDPGEQAQALQRLHAAGAIPAAGCATMDETLLPARTRSHPTDPGKRLNQRHRWRLRDGAVVVDPSVKGPDDE